MDVNTMRSVVTVVFLAIFLAIVAWAYSRKNRHDFEDAAAVPFLDEDTAEIKIGDARE